MTWLRQHSDDFELWVRKSLPSLSSGCRMPYPSVLYFYLFTLHRWLASNPAKYCNTCSTNMRLQVVLLEYSLPANHCEPRAYSKCTTARPPSEELFAVSARVPTYPTGSWRLPMHAPHIFPALPSPWAWITSSKVGHS